MTDPEVFRQAAAHVVDLSDAEIEEVLNGAVAGTNWPPLEDWGLATPSNLSKIEYIANLLRPGRILLVAAVEGVGKSYAIDGELAIRLAVAGGNFAGTWCVLRTGVVVTFSEMHRDDDLEYRDTVLAALGHSAAELVGKYWHQNLMLAAGGEPALTSPRWQQETLGRCRDLEAIALIVDTATTATGGIEPWGAKMVTLVHQLRAMLSAYPALAIILVVHLRKPTGRGRGERQITDVLGDWGKWADALLLMEDDGANKTKLTTYKRVGQQRRVVAKRQGGLLVDPIDITEQKTATKVPQEELVAAVDENPGVAVAALAERFHVTERTVKGHVERAASLLEIRKDSGKYGKLRVYRRNGHLPWA